MTQERRGGITKAFSRPNIGLQLATSRNFLLKRKKRRKRHLFGISIVASSPCLAHQDDARGGGGQLQPLCGGWGQLRWYQRAGAIKLRQEQWRSCISGGRLCVWQEILLHREPNCKSISQVFHNTCSSTINISRQLSFFSTCGCPF